MHRRTRRRPAARSLRAHRRIQPSRNPVRLAIGLCLAIASLAGANEPEWTLEREAEGITVETRPVPDSGVREFRGVTEVAAPTEEILALLRDSDRFSAWFPNTPESRLLAREDGVSYRYSVMATPWPISERDNVLRSSLHSDPATSIVQIDLEAAPEYYAEQSGRVRVRRARGSWTLEPLAERRTRVTFRMHLEPGGDIPEWMVNTRVVETPFEALTNLRETVER